MSFKTLSKTKKIFSIFSIILAIIFVAIGIFLIVWFCGDSYSQFNSLAEKEFAIPGLSSGFTPQGLDYEETDNIFLVCGYMNNGSASRVYVVDENIPENNKYITLTFEEKDYKGHAGGIATDGTSVWIVGEGVVNRFLYSDLKNAQNGEKIEIKDKFESKNGADFVLVDNNSLWVGEFHRSGKYDTNKSHKIEIEKNQFNYALTFKYNINENNTYGLESTTPVLALSHCSLVQGMEITDGKILLSCSYSLPDAHIYIYENILSKSSSKNFTYDEENEIPLYILTRDDLIGQVTTPSMSEEIVIANNKLFVLFENACKKYSLFTREKLVNVYSFTLEKLDNLK